MGLGSVKVALGKAFYCFGNDQTVNKPELRNLQIAKGVALAVAATFLALALAQGLNGVGTLARGWDTAASIGFYTAGGAALITLALLSISHRNAKKLFDTQNPPDARADAAPAADGAAAAAPVADAGDGDAAPVAAADDGGAAAAAAAAGAGRSPEG